MRTNIDLNAFRKFLYEQLFFKSFWRTHWLAIVLIPLFLDFWWHLLWVSKPEWALPYSLFCRGECNVHSARSTSGATHADLLAAGSTAACISRGGTWLRFEWAITRTEDKHATIVRATRLSTNNLILTWNGAYLLCNFKVTCISQCVVGNAFG